ncbi:site-specific DNA-methyltransferase [Leptospira fluminis]|uniref:Methyltransferase n=1 Tax=Leptospira fluminis TaxID=2484979 RepID=A0A4R9GS53_9LEPT|nr:site-specific DNA-methyltransferase [Leptospira fluminis]TGK19956.1 site-specific DNA-methyltransferase [Leptospira fluminis]
MNALEKESVHLVVTSPPYPMVQMWDGLFKSWDSQTEDYLNREEGKLAFERMHLQLDKVWKGCFRVLKNGGIMAVNIGDATRNLGQEFRLYSNHSRILQSCLKYGFSCMPDILWRKQTNSPTKFMGSGMFPVGAYVTYEHEYILLLRKGGKREYSKAESESRRESAFFWEERNKWFSDIWEIKGERQVAKDLGTSRTRTAAFPLEFAYRLINMFSIKGDLVLDPFLGTGTTSLAAAIAGRNSVGFEIESDILEMGKRRMDHSVGVAKEVLEQRWNEHLSFLSLRRKAKGTPAYLNEFYSVRVVTNQERKLKWEKPVKIEWFDPSVCKIGYVPFLPKNGKKSG